MSALTQRARVRLRRVPFALDLKLASLEVLDRLDSALGRGGDLEPPRRLRQVGAGDFRRVGTTLLDQLVQLGGLVPDARVLDIGCGVGRLAIPLTRYLAGGSYGGFDVSAPAIDWCQAAITPRFPRFQFTTIDAANTHYNPAGGLDARGVRFPYPDDSFDCAVAYSLFTHLLPAACANYLCEAARVLTPGGTFFGTFFLINDDTRQRLAKHQTDIALPYSLIDPTLAVEYRAMDDNSPETALGLREAFVRKSLERAGLEDMTIHRGTWSGAARSGPYQDIVIGRRAA